MQVLLLIMTRECCSATFISSLDDSLISTRRPPRPFPRKEDCLCGNSRVGCAPVGGKLAFIYRISKRIHICITDFLNKWLSASSAKNVRDTAQDIAGCHGMSRKPVGLHICSQRLMYNACNHFSTQCSHICLSISVQRRVCNACVVQSQYNNPVQPRIQQQMLQVSKWLRIKTG